jgi:hypothetical protein
MKEKKNPNYPPFFAKIEKTLESKNWRDFPKKLAKLVELFDTSKTKQNLKFCPFFFWSAKNNTVTGDPVALPPTSLTSSVTARTDTASLTRAAHARFRNGRCDDLPGLD